MAEVILTGKEVKNIGALIVQKAICQLLREGKVSAAVLHPKGTTEINLQAKNYYSYLAQVESQNWNIVGYKLLETNPESSQFTPEKLADTVISDLYGLLVTLKPLSMSNYTKICQKNGIETNQLNLKIFGRFIDFLHKNNFPPLNILLKNTTANTNPVMTREIFLKILGDKNNLKTWNNYFANGTVQITGFEIDPAYIESKNKPQPQNQPVPTAEQKPPVQPTQSNNPRDSLPEILPEIPKTEKEKTYQYIGSWMTGVRIIQDDKTGEAVSAGFTGQYIQNTAGEIPEDIQNTIRNRLFAIAEGGAKDGLNTVVGRVINGKTVVASVNRIKDDRGRSASGYRYQMGQGGTMSDILPKIQTCSLENNGAGGHFPFAGQNPNFELESLPNWSEIKSLIDNSQPNRPLILDSNKQYPISVAIKITERLAQKYKIEPSFAYHVTALEKPAEFLVIVPYDQKSQELITRNIESIKPVDNRDKFNPESNLKATMKGLLFSEPKEETLQNLAQIIAEIDQNPKKYKDWEATLQSQGLDEAFTQQLISLQYPQLVLLQLLTAPNIDFTQANKYQNYFELLNKQKNDHGGKTNFIKKLELYSVFFRDKPKIQNRIIKIREQIIIQKSMIDKIKDKIKEVF